MKFKIKSSDAHCYLGIQIKRDRDSKRIQLSQAAYTRSVLEKFQHSECNAVSVPADIHTKLVKNSEQNFLYRELIGSLMYLAIGTRPDTDRYPSHT